MSIDIANESGVAVGEERLAALARHVLDEMRIHPLAELSILLVDDAAMADLNQRWMGEQGPTDVLAFPMDELRPPHYLGGRNGKAGGAEPEPQPGLLGDVVLCPQIAAEQARAHGHPAPDEVDLLCIHGILHLLGYDHADPDEHAAMFSLQEQLLASWRAASGRAADLAAPPSASGERGHTQQPGSAADGAGPDGPAADTHGGGPEGPG